MNWKFTNDKTWKSLEERFCWVRDMNGVLQDPVFHAEGDVAIHTRMVIDSLQSIPDFNALSDLQREILWTSALLHDVEKRSTTRTEDDGRITSAGHAKRGEFTSRNILFTDVETPFSLREHIAALVRYHGLPLWIMEKKDPAKAVIEASLRTDMKLLALLAEADVRGRICSDQSELLERIELFRAYCEEQQCWNSERQFPSGLARFTYFKKSDSSPDYVPFDDLKSEVVMLSGLPGMEGYIYPKELPGYGGDQS